jgi:two-component system chemotaxis response regulator CheY
MQRRGLIVDDEAVVCEQVRNVLNSASMEALTVTRSTEALGLLSEGKFDMVFLDLHMAAPDGLELAREIRRSPWYRTTPIFLISDDQRPSAVGMSFEAGASFFLYKPIDKERLLKLVRATQGSMEHEMRRTRRVALQAKVRVKLGIEELEGETVNISLSGVLVRAARVWPTGSLVHLTLQLSQRMKAIVGAGSVVRVANGNLMGIRMDGLPAGESERLQEFLLPLIPGE